MANACHDTLTNLPAEVLVHVLAQLNCHDLLLSAALVCRRLSDAAQVTLSLRVRQMTVTVRDARQAAAVAALVDRAQSMTVVEELTIRLPWHFPRINLGPGYGVAKHPAHLLLAALDGRRDVWPAVTTLVIVTHTPPYFGVKSYRKDSLPRTYVTLMERLWTALAAAAPRVRRVVSHVGAVPWCFTTDVSERWPQARHLTRHIDGRLSDSQVARWPHSFAVALQ